MQVLVERDNVANNEDTDMKTPTKPHSMSITRWVYRAWLRSRIDTYTRNLHAIAVQPVVSLLAPPELVGRYMALVGIAFSTGLALGPALSASALAISPSLPWIAGAAGMAVVFPLVAPAYRRATEPRGAVAPSAVDGSARPSMSSSAG